MGDKETAKELIQLIRPFIKSVRYTGNKPDFRKAPTGAEFELLMNSLYELIIKLEGERMPS